MSWLNPNFFYNYQKMYGQRSEKDHNNYVERVLNSEDEKLKSYTSNSEVLLQLEEEMKRFVAF